MQGRKKLSDKPAMAPRGVQGAGAGQMLRGMARDRWQYDLAREPDDYPDVDVKHVTLDGDVVTVRDEAGDVLNRYRLLPDKEGYRDPAFDRLAEL